MEMNGRDKGKSKKTSLLMGRMVILLGVFLFSACGNGAKVPESGEINENGTYDEAGTEGLEREGATSKAGDYDGAVSRADQAEGMHALPVVNITCKAKYDSGTL